MLRLFIVAALASAALPVAAGAQADLPGRVGRLEGEMRAVQRKVFPNGAGQLVQPELGEGGAPAPVPGTPSSSALVDLTSRVAGLEGQMATLTGQVEQGSYRLRQLQDQFEAYRRATDGRLAAIGTAGGPPLAGDTGGEPLAATDAPPPARSRPVPPRPPRGAPTPVAAPADLPRDAGPRDAEPRDAGPRDAGPPAPSGVAVERPRTGDAAEDDYLYGYRLWQARQYAAAEAQLKKVVATYPASKRASYAQNLLGRAYLDDGKPSLASMAFYDNYKKMPDGERAPDSLYYLAQALVKLNKPADACKVYGELSDVYGGKISASMEADVTRGRAAAKCQ